MEPAPVGKELKRRRGDADMSQRELAERSEVSVDLIRKLEQGVRQTASIPSLQKLARALDTTVAELLAKSTALPSEDKNSGIVAIRRVLTSVDDLIDEVTESPEPVSVDETAREVVYAWGAYWSGRYEDLTTLIPQAIIRARAAEHSAPSADKARAADLLTQLYQVTLCTLVHLGKSDTAWLAEWRARDAVNRGSDPLRAAALRGTTSWLLLTDGRYEESLKVAKRAALSLQPTGDVAPQQLSVYGSLLLTGATAAGRGKDRGTAAGLLTEADAIAGRLGGPRNDYESAFSDAQVIMQTADVQVVTEQYGAALKTARRMPRDHGLPLAARARHLADVAFSQARTGRREQATDTLLTVESAAPDWLKHQKFPKQTIRELMRHERPTRLRELATRVGVKPE